MPTVSGSVPQSFVGAVGYRSLVPCAFVSVAFVVARESDVWGSLEYTKSEDRSSLWEVFVPPQLKRDFYRLRIKESRSPSVKENPPQVHTTPQCWPLNRRRAKLSWRDPGRSPSEYRTRV